MIVGTCGICGGPVECPDTFLSIYPPTPTCRHCGAVPKQAFGPVIDMEPRRMDRQVAGDDLWARRPSTAAEYWPV